jgi:hypothetical protein
LDIRRLALDRSLRTGEIALQGGGTFRKRGRLRFGHQPREGSAEETGDCGNNYYSR